LVLGTCLAVSNDWHSEMWLTMQTAKLYHRNKNTDINYLLILFVKKLIIDRTSINTLPNLFCRPTFQMRKIYITIL